MSQWSPAQGLFLGCCRPCHTTIGEEVYVRRSLDDRPDPLGFPRPPVLAGAASARGGDDFADWAPRAAMASGHHASSSLAPPQELLIVDEPEASFGRTSSPPADIGDPAAKASERSRLRRLVSEFVQEAACGRPCSVIALDDASSSVGVRRDARYGLCDEVERLVLHRKADTDGAWECLGAWPLQAVLGAHRAEESALVRSFSQELSCQLTGEELRRSAILDFGGACAVRSQPLLLIEESPEHRDRLVSGVQILRLYRGAAKRLESARGVPCREQPMLRLRAGSASGSPGAHNGGGAVGGPCAPTRVGAIADDKPAEEDLQPRPGERRRGALAAVKK